MFQDVYKRQDSNRVDSSEAFGTNLYGKSADFESRTVYSQIIENKPAERRNGSAGLFVYNQLYILCQDGCAAGRYMQEAVFQNGLSVIGIKDIFESAFVEMCIRDRFYNNMTRTEAWALLCSVTNERSYTTEVTQFYLCHFAES